jgi:hypothetical protein
MLARILLPAFLTACGWAQTVYDEDQLLPPQFVSGTVVTESGTPVARAAVDVRTETSMESISLGRGESDSQGRFRILVTRPSRRRWTGIPYITVEASGYAPSRLEHIYTPPPDLDVGPIAVHAAVEMRGHVWTTRGVPIAGAEIHAGLGAVKGPHSDYARSAPIAVTDEHGEFSCRSLPPGLVTVGASAIGFADRMPGPISLLAGSPNQVDFTLDAERTVTIRAVSTTGKPLFGLKADAPRASWSCASRESELPSRAFWRGAESGDDRDTIVLHGLDAEFAGEIELTADDHQTARVLFDSARTTVVLHPVGWIDIIASSRDGSSTPDLYFVTVEDATRPASWCGNCDETRWARLWRDSTAVTVIAPNHWRVAWNSPGCYVDGGRPNRLSAELVNGQYANCEIPPGFGPGSRFEARLPFAEHGALSGTVRDRAGNGLSLRLGVQLSLYSSDFVSVVSDSDGRFAFESIDDGPNWFFALDDRWELAGTGRVELQPGQKLGGVKFTAIPRRREAIGIVRGTITIEGKPPGVPVLVALDQVPYQHLPSGEPFGVAWTDSEGHFEISALRSDRFHIVAKHHTANSAGGWRDFSSEFPAHGEDWPWIVSVPESGDVRADIQLPAESRWESIAPPKND